MKMHEILDEIAYDICNNYCKYPEYVHQLYLMDRIETEDGKTDYLTEHYCNECPLTTKL